MLPTLTRAAVTLGVAAAAVLAVAPAASAHAVLRSTSPRADATVARLPERVVVTFDEDDIRSGNQVLTVVMNAALSGKHKVVTTSLNHYSLSGYYSHVLRAPLLRKATSGFASAFGLP